MAATNKRRQLVDYSVKGLGLSKELELEQGLHVVTAIIPVIAYDLMVNVGLHLLGRTNKVI